jgi:hypothetical protein
MRHHSAFGFMPSINAATPNGTGGETLKERIDKLLQKRKTRKAFNHWSGGPLHNLPIKIFLSLHTNLVQTRAVDKRPRFSCDIRVSFATAFKNWRRKNKIPLKKIATDLGLSVSTVSSWELGERFPTGRHFEMLVNYTGEPPCKLFCVMADKCVPVECLLAMGRRP